MLELAKSTVELGLDIDIEESSGDDYHGRFDEVGKIVGQHISALSLMSNCALESLVG